MNRKRLTLEFQLGWQAFEQGVAFFRAACEKRRMLKKFKHLNNLNYFVVR